MNDGIIGIDISKDHLDAHALATGEDRRFDNTTAGIDALRDWIGADAAKIVYEPTGPYHRALEAVLAQAGLPLVKVNPRSARRFAEACGQLAKTDRIDARMLARMGAALDLEPRAVADETLNRLKELSVARNALVKDRTAARNRAHRLTISLLRQQAAQRLKQIERQIRAVDTAIAATIDASPELRRKRAILLSIPGVAETTAAAMLVEMPELGALTAKQAASLAGLAPVTRQSGRWTGKACIRGGRATLRQALYMPALVATRFNEDLAAKYQALIKAGKPPKLAITAIMRKLLIRANALLRDNRNWTENPA